MVTEEMVLNELGISCILLNHSCPAGQFGLGQSGNSFLNSPPPWNGGRVSMFVSFVCMPAGGAFNLGP